MRGFLLFGSLAFVTGAAPWALPALYLAWAAVALPLRVHEFVTTRRAAFLLEFCYVSLSREREREGWVDVAERGMRIKKTTHHQGATRRPLSLFPLNTHGPLPSLSISLYQWINLATIALLLGPPVPASWEASGRALADGPIAAALLVWQCPWDFGSWSAGTSVLLHLLPGLALYARTHHPPPVDAPEFLKTLLASPGAVAARAATTPPTFASLWLAPFAVYVVWQVAYGLILQASPLRDYILARKLDTSYRTLARRAAGAKNVWARICRGSDGTAPPLRKVMGYGFLQVLFTAFTLGVAAPAHATHATTVVWQAAKFAVPLYFGARVAGDRGPKRGVTRMLRDAQFVGAVAGLAGGGAEA